MEKFVDNYIIHNSGLLNRMNMNFDGVKKYLTELLLKMKKLGMPEDRSRYGILIDLDKFNPTVDDIDFIKSYYDIPYPKILKSEDGRFYMYTSNQSLFYNLVEIETELDYQNHIYYNNLSSK